jgi:hypothetical protein
MIRVQPICSEADDDAALAEITTYFEREPEPGSAEADRFDVLAALIRAYEDVRWPIEAPHPLSAIRHVMEMRAATSRAIWPRCWDPARAPPKALTAGVTSRLRWPRHSTRNGVSPPIASSAHTNYDPSASAALLRV